VPAILVWGGSDVFRRPVLAHPESCISVWARPSDSVRAMVPGEAAESYSAARSGAGASPSAGMRAMRAISGDEASTGMPGSPGPGVDSLLGPDLLSHQQGLWACAFDRDA